MSEKNIMKEKSREPIRKKQKSTREENVINVDKEEKTVFTKCSLFKCYQTFVMVTSGLALVFFVLHIILANLPNGWQVQWVNNWSSIFHSLTSIICLFLVLCVIFHVMALLVQLFITKHSLFWLLSKQWVPIVLPIIFMTFIKLLGGQLDDKISDLIVGICSGAVSSMIVLILDRKHTFAERILRNVAPEFSQTDNIAADSK